MMDDASAPEHMAQILAPAAIDLGDEQAVLSALLKAEVPIDLVLTHLDSAIDRARVLRAGALEIDIT